MNVLAVGSHPDDLEVGVAGTLLKHKARGDSVNLALTTWGGYGARPEDTIKHEMENAEKVLGAKYIIFDNKMNNYTTNWKTVSELDDLIADLKADTVYCNWYGDSHQNHQTTCRNVVAACRTRKVKNLYLYELANYSQRSLEVFEPTRFVDISEFINKKVEAVKCYKTYPVFNDDFIGSMVGLAKFRGHACGFYYAEAFEVVFETWF